VESVRRRDVLWSPSRRGAVSDGHEGRLRVRQETIDIDESVVYDDGTADDTGADSGSVKERAPARVDRCRSRSTISGFRRLERLSGGEWL